MNFALYTCHSTKLIFVICQVLMEKQFGKLFSSYICHSYTVHPPLVFAGHSVLTPAYFCIHGNHLRKYDIANPHIGRYLTPRSTRDVWSGWSKACPQDPHLTVPIYERTQELADSIEQAHWMRRRNHMITDWYVCINRTYRWCNVPALLINQP